MATIFKIRRDTAANWSSNNPTLSAGEMGLDQTNNFIKMGDGSTAWNSLAQFTQNIENVEDLVGAMVTSNTETFITVTYDDSDGTLDFVVPVQDEDGMDSNSATHLATQQSIKAYVDAQLTAQDLDFIADSGGALSIDLDSETLDIAGGTGIDTTGSGNEVSIAIDSTVATLTGSQTLTNKTLTAATLAGTTAFTGAATTTSTFDGRDVATDGTKLDGIEAAADVTDATNVNAAGALMLSDTTTSGLGIVVDEDNMASNSATKVATQQSIKAYVDAQITAEDLDIAGDSGTGAIDLDSETLTIAGTANQIATAMSGNTLTVSMPDNVTIAGNLTVSGTQTTVSSTTVNVADPLLHLATNNDSADAVDIGVYGLYDTSGSQDLYGGIFRDASDSGKWKLYKDSQTAPTTTVNVSATGHATGTLVADVEGDLTGTVTGAASLNLLKTGGAMTGAITTNSTFDGVDIATRDGVLTSTTTTANAALPKAGGAMTGAITTNSTFDGVDIATRDAILTSTTTTANAALPKAGGAMTGAITTNSTFDGRDVATDGTKLDAIEAAADVTDATNVNAAGALMLSDTTTAGLGIVIDEDGMGTNSATKVPTQQSVKAYVDAQVTASDLDFQGDSGGALSIDLDSEVLDIAGGTGIDTVGSGNTVTASIDSTVTTLTGSQTLTNKTLTSPVLNTATAGTSLSILEDAVVIFEGATGNDFETTLTVVDPTADRTVSLPNATDTLVGKATTDTLTNKTLTAATLTSPVLNTGVSGSAIKDQDNMSSDSATHLATQQSIKAYVDAQTTDETAEGSNNLYYTAERFDDRLNAVMIAGTNLTATYDDAANTYRLDAAAAGGYDLSGNDTDDIAEGSSNLYHTTARARASISVTDAGGDGSCAYNSTSGVITYTGPSAAEVRAHLSAGTGVAYSGGAFSIGQAVATDSDVTFDDVVVAGTLTVNGTTTTVATTNMVVSDKLIELANGASGSPSGDLGIIMERGSSNNAFIGWDESADKFIVGTGTFTGASTGNLSITTGTLVANLDGATATLTGNIVVGGTVDGRDVAADGTKLDAIEAQATADQTGAQIKTLYEAESSAFTDAQFTKLANIEASADVTDATNVNAAGALMLSDTTTAGLGIVIDEDNFASDVATKVPTQQSVKAYVDAETTARVAADAAQNHLSELGGTLDDIGDGSTYKLSHNSLTDALLSKLNAIEAAADVTDATNVDAAGAVMESGATASAKIPSGTTVQRDGSPSAGYFRWNTTTGGAEIYDGSAWGLVGGGNTTDEPLWEHESVVSSNYVMTDGNNAVSCGPITINTGYSVTVGSGSTWAIV